MRALFLAVLLSAMPAIAQIAGVEAARRSVLSVEGLLKQRPEDPTLWYYLSRFQAEAGNKAGAVAAMEKVVEFGDGLVPVRDQFEPVWDLEAFQAARAKLEAAAPRMDFAPTVFEIEDRELIPEGIAWDSATGHFFLGSMKRKIMRVSSTGVVEFAGAEADLDHVLGLAVDAPRRLLYAVSTSALTEEGEKKRRNAVVVFDLERGKLLRRVDVPGALQLNDVAIARGGRAFASDSQGGGIFEILESGTARELVAPGQIRGTNGLAVSPDVKRLYAAHSTGVAVIDLADPKSIKRLAVPPRQSVAAIDGLYEWQGQLIGVQNHTTPGRVILMTLSADGNAITRVQTLLSHHHPSLDEPTTGAVTDRGFYLLAATGVSHFNRKGLIDNRDSLRKPTVLRVLLPR